MGEVGDMEAALYIEGRAFDVFDAQDAAYADECDAVQEVGFLVRGRIGFVPPNVINIAKRTDQNADGLFQQGVEFVQYQHQRLVQGAFHKDFLELFLAVDILEGFPQIFSDFFGDRRDDLFGVRLIFQVFQVEFQDIEAIIFFQAMEDLLHGP